MLLGISPELFFFFLDEPSFFVRLQALIFVIIGLSCLIGSTISHGCFAILGEARADWTAEASTYGEAGPEVLVGFSRAQRRIPVVKPIGWCFLSLLSFLRGRREDFS